MMISEMTRILSGPVGDLEISVSDKNPKNAVAIICHPHPLHGGTMNNKVVTTLVRTFQQLGLRTVRFNFRGVGKSVGVFDHGIGETEDLFAVVEWVKKNYPEEAIWLAGFSFGAFVAARAATQIPVQQLVTVAPQVSRFIETNLPEITCPWVLVQGEKDEVISPEEVFAWVETLQHKPVLIRMPKAGHFFHGQLLDLQRLLENTLKDKFD